MNYFFNAKACTELLLLCWNCTKLSVDEYLFVAKDRAFEMKQRGINWQFLRLYGYIANLRKKYGPVFTFFGLMKPYIVVCDPIVVRRILSDPKSFIKGSDYTYQFAVAFGEGLVTSNGDKHRRDRATFNKYFIRSSVTKFTPSINKITNEVMASALSAIDSSSTSMNIESFFAALSLRVFMRFAIGTDYSADRKREEEVCHVVSKGSFAIGRSIGLGLPMWRIIPLVDLIYTSTENLLVDFRKFLKIRKAAMANGEADGLDDCLTAMIQENMSMKEMEDHYVTLISAGHDTTAFFSAYLCFLLGKHPEAQDTLLAEILGRFPLTDSPDDDATITADDVAELKFLNQVMQETLRLYSIIPQISRYSVAEVEIPEANVTIPKGANILIPLAVINRDPSIWGNDAAEFRPERFADKGMDFTAPKQGFYPFGYSTRVCIGNTLAQIESAIFICKLLRKYRIEQDPGFSPHIMSGISLTTSNGIHVILKKRN